MKIYYTNIPLIDNLLFKEISSIKSDILTESSLAHNIQIIITELYIRNQVYQIFINLLENQKKQIIFEKSNGGISLRTSHFFCKVIYDTGLLDFQHFGQEKTETDIYSAVKQWLEASSEESIDQLICSAKRSIEKIQEYAKNLKLNSQLLFSQQQLNQLAQIYSQYQEISEPIQNQSIPKASCQELQELLDEKMVAHILGGAWAKDLGLEGMSQESALNYLQEHLASSFDDSNSLGNKLSLKEDLTKAKDLANQIQSLVTADDFKQSCETLIGELFEKIDETTEGVLIPGGWSGTYKTDYSPAESGHSMYY